MIAVTVDCADALVWNLQPNYPEGAKRLLKGGRAAYLFWQRCVQPEGLHAALLIGEGVTTMAAVHARIAGCKSISANNPESSTRAMAARHGTRQPG